eukprot:6467051-Amphidinium_carterae.1
MMKHGRHADALRRDLSMMIVGDMYAECSLGLCLAGSPHCSNWDSGDYEDPGFIMQWAVLMDGETQIHAFASHCIVLVILSWCAGQQTQHMQSKPAV